jgi:hypothetical protein
MEGSVVHCTIAEKSHGYLPGTHQFRTVTATAGLQDARADDAAGSHHADLGREQMHTTSATTRTTCGASKKLCHQFPGGHAFRECMTVPAVRTKNWVIVFQLRTDSCRNRFLSNIGMAGTVNQAALMAPRKFLFGKSNQQHGTVQTKQVV